MTQTPSFSGQLPGLADLPTDLSTSCVFVRVDFNVPMDGDRIVDDARIRQALPTIRTLRGRGARVVVASHRGRPGGEHQASLSLEPVASALAELLAGESSGEGSTRVHFCSDCVGDVRAAAQDALPAGAVLLLENLRFHPGEKENDPAFAAALAQGCSAYINDAFGSAHRAHASVSKIVENFDLAVAGQLMQREVQELGTLLAQPTRPFVAVLGGAKISGKIDTLKHLVETVDALVIGGAMANTFLLAGGAETGRSLVEEKSLDDARRIGARANERGIELHLPVDLVVTDQLDAPDNASRVALTVDAEAVPADRLAVDVGPRSSQLFGQAIAAAGSVFWNGPMGVFEIEPFAAGTRAVAAAVGATAGYSVVGGGETAAAARAAGVLDQIDWVSTGGGASLELLAGQELPGVRALRRTYGQRTGEET